MLPKRVQYNESEYDIQNNDLFYKKDLEMSVRVDFEG